MSPHCIPSQARQACLFFGTLAIALAIPAAAAATLFTASTVMVATVETYPALQADADALEAAEAAAFDACADQFDSDPAGCGDE